MASFDFSALRDDRRTYQLFRYGPVSLFFKPQVLEAEIQFLQDQSYIIHEFNCQIYDSEAALFNAILKQLKIIQADYEGIKASQFWDLLSEGLLQVPEDSGLILVFTQFDALHRRSPKGAHELLEMIADYHYKWLWFGLRFKAFLQTDDPNLKLEKLGAQSAWWNDKEYLIKNRTP